MYYEVIDTNSSFFGMVGEFNREISSIGQIELWFYDRPFKGTWLFSREQIKIVS